VNLRFSSESSSAVPAPWEDEPLPASDGFDTRRAMRLGAGLVAALFVLAAFIPIGGAVIGSGQVGVETRVKKIAHPFGGVIREILVTNGEHVTRGQLLLHLDDKVSGADATYSSLTVEQLLAQRARLEAERIGAGTIACPAELAAAGTDGARKAMNDEVRLFALRRSEENQMRLQLGARIAQLRNEVVSIEAQIASFRRQRELIEPERAGVKELWDKNLVTINRLNQMERTAAEIDGRIASLTAQIAQTRSQIIETQERQIQLGQTRRVEAGNELARVTTVLNEQQFRRVQAGDQHTRNQIRAPYDGTVEKIAVSAIGEVIRAAEPIMEIVPDADDMVLEVAISPTDVDQVRNGQNARIRFSSFNRAATPELAGKVTYVATDRSSDSDGKRSFYLVRVAIDARQVKREGLELRSGMPAEVHIETGNRSMLSYVTKPLRDQIARAFRDN
jgi:HlyD family secretion protein